MRIPIFKSLNFLFFGLLLSVNLNTLALDNMVITTSAESPSTTNSILVGTWEHSHLDTNSHFHVSYYQNGTSKLTIYLADTSQIKGYAVANWTLDENTLHTIYTNQTNLDLNLVTGIENIEILQTFDNDPNHIQLIDINTGEIKDLFRK